MATPSHGLWYTNPAGIDSATEPDVLDLYFHAGGDLTRVKHITLYRTGSEVMTSESGTITIGRMESMDTRSHPYAAVTVPGLDEILSLEVVEPIEDIDEIQQDYHNCQKITLFGWLPIIGPTGPEFRLFNNFKEYQFFVMDFWDFSGTKTIKHVKVAIYNRTKADTAAFYLIGHASGKTVHQYVKIAELQDPDKHVLEIQITEAAKICPARLFYNERKLAELCTVQLFLTDDDREKMLKKLTEDVVTNVVQCLDPARLSASSSDAPVDATPGMSSSDAPIDAAVAGVAASDTEAC